MDLNLLPQDLRAKEEKERQKAQRASHSEETQLYHPPKEKGTNDLRRSDKPQLTFWRWLLGFPNPSQPVPAKLTQPTAVPVDSKLKGDWLKPDQGASLKATAGKNKKIKSTGFWSGLFGRPVSPIIVNTPSKVVKNSDQQPIPKPVEKKIERDLPPVSPSVAPKELNRQHEYFIKTEAKEASKRKKPAKGDNWWNILADLFSINRKRRIDLRFAGAEEKKPLPAKEAPPLAKKSSKHEEKSAKPAVAHKTPFHLAPKRERTPEFDVNLIPKDSRTESRHFEGELKFLLISIITPIILILASYTVIFFLQNNVNNQLVKQKETLAKLEIQIGDFLSREKQNNEFASRLSTLKKINQEKITWDNFFTLLERYTLNGVYFTGLSADTSGILNLPGVADSYSILAKQLALLRDADEFVKDYKISNAQLYSEGKAGVIGVSFQVRLVLADNVLHNLKK